MSQEDKAILRIPQTVRDDVRDFRRNVEKFINGDTTPISFRAYRVPMGIYEQRTVDTYMVRIRIGAGLVTPEQLECIAELSKSYGNGILHITTRQDIQIHSVSVEKLPDVLERLLEAGLAARGGGGNTVRNISACPYAGICPKEKFDVSGHAVATAEYLLQNRSSFNLPRKFKLAFAGCDEDCTLASVADLGFFAATRNGEKGFEVYAGGGLGPNASVGVKVEDFVGETQVFEVAEAVKRLFDKHGDRANKHRARLRYVLARVGTKEFTRLYKEEREKISNEGLSDDVPQIRQLDLCAPPVENAAVTESPNIIAERSAGRFMIRLRLDLGDISAGDLVEVADIARELGYGPVRTTQLQDLLIPGVAAGDVDKAIGRLKAIGLDPLTNGTPKVVACAGAATCKLGLCLSRGLSSAISEKLCNVKDPDTVIRISGCPNCCGHHHVASIGFQGKAKRVNDRLMPCYDVMAGAKIHQGDSNLAEMIGTVPAKRIPHLLAEAFSLHATDKDQLKTLVKKYSDLSGDLPDDMFYDFGEDEPFSLAGRGPGECGAGVMDVIKVDIDVAASAVKSAESSDNDRDKTALLYDAIVASARSLLVIFGKEPKKDRQIFSDFTELMIKPGWVKADSQQLLDAALDFKLGDISSLAQFESRVIELARRVSELFLSLDASLKFRADPIEKQQESASAQTETETVDLRGVTCPINFVKAKLALEKVEVGQTLEIVLDDGEPIRNVPASFTDQGQEVLETRQVDDHFVIKILRKS